MDEECRLLLGITLSDKKFHKLRWDELAAACRRRGYEPRKLDLEKPLNDQGPLKVFVHKLTDTLAAADLGDSKCKEIIRNVEQYITDNPDMIVIDPIDNVKILLDRYRYYTILEKQSTLLTHGVFTPTFCMLSSNNLKENLNAMKMRNVNFPLVCKTLLAHGAKSAHRMSVIFNEAGLVHCKTPCVLQSFVNHNAILYKVFLVGNRYHIVERPSLKNFYPCNQRESIHFNSGEVCKSDSQSTLSILDPHEAADIESKPRLDTEKIELILKVLREELKLTLFGVDVVIDNKTNDYAIIDINFYPGYDGFPNFFDHLVNCIDESIIESDYRKKNIHNISYCKNNYYLFENGSAVQKLINVNLIEMQNGFK